ncbi:hypothetical protein PTKIN_Ptkin04bG0026700 [Pterospermum kingtungense]
MEVPRSKYTPFSDFGQQQKFHMVHNTGRRSSGLDSSTKISQKCASPISGSNINMAQAAFCAAQVAFFAAQAAGVNHSTGETLKRGIKKSHTGKKSRPKKRCIDETELGNPMSMGNERKAFDDEMDKKVEDAPSVKPGIHKSMGFADIKSSIQAKKSYTVDLDVSATKEPDLMAMDVPDPAYHDFDQDR